jgi:SAM-dependent methyltransferase
MFDFLRKTTLWQALDKGYLDQLKPNKISYQLKTAQDVAVYSYIKDSKDFDIAEIGGGDSRILEKLAENNRCVNVEKFEGEALGPVGEVNLSKVTNINCFIGDFSPQIKEELFDIIFSISVVEHIETQNLDSFYRDSLRILKKGGKFVHAIDMYLQDSDSAYNNERFDIYKSWVCRSGFVKPMGNVFVGGLGFATDMVSNPDNILYGWNQLVPSLSRLRAHSQSVTLLLGAIKT